MVLTGARRYRVLQADIIRDRRVTDFPFAPSQQVTPGELAEPILDRIANADVSETVDQKQLEANRTAVTRLARVFSLLPACAAAPMQHDLQIIAHDDARRPYASAIFSRLADAGPSSAGDFSYLLTTSVAAIGNVKYRWEWEKTEGQVVIVALEGLAKLGPSGKAAASAVVAALKDQAAMSALEFTHEMPNVGIIALTSLGEIETLRNLYGTYDPKFVEAVMRQ